MSYTVRAAPALHYAWMAERTGCRVNPDEFRAIEAVDAKGTIVGMCGFDSWTPNAVNFSVALDRPVALRRLIEPAAQYVRGTGRRLVNMLIRSDNARSLKLAAAFGFKPVHVIRGGWSKDVDIVMFELRLAEGA